MARRNYDIIVFDGAKGNFSFENVKEGVYSFGFFHKSNSTPSETIYLTPSKRKLTVFTDKVSEIQSGAIVTAPIINTSSYTQNIFAHELTVTTDHIQMPIYDMYASNVKNTLGGFERSNLFGLPTDAWLVLVKQDGEFNDSSSPIQVPGYSWQYNVNIDSYIARYQDRHTFNGGESIENLPVGIYEIWQELPSGTLNGTLDGFTNSVITPAYGANTTSSEAIICNKTVDIIYARYRSLLRKTNAGYTVFTQNNSFNILNTDMFRGQWTKTDFILGNTEGPIYFKPLILNPSDTEWA